MQRPAPPDTALESARETYYAAVVGTLKRRFEARAAADEIAASVRRMFRLRLLSYLTISVAGNASIVGGRPLGPNDFDIPPLVPSGSVTAAAGGLALVIRGHLRLDSIWFRAGLRAALALGLAVLIAKLGEVQHAFWVVLATVSVLKSNAISTSYAAWQALAGTLVGFGLSTAVILAVHDDATALWILFPICAFLAVYTPTAVHVAVGQAMFTVTVVVLFNLIEPEGWRTGLVRVEDILIGAATAVVVGFLLWPRGARAQLRQALAALYESGGAYVHAALDGAHGRAPERVPGAAGDARGAGLRAAEALSTYLNEHGPKRVPTEVWTKLLATGRQLRLVGDAVVVRTGTYGRVEGFEAVVDVLESEAAALEGQIDDVADAIAGADGAVRLPRPEADETEAVIRASVASCDGVPSSADVEQMLALAWAGEWIAHVRTRLAALGEPLEQFRAFVPGAGWR